MSEQHRHECEVRMLVRMYRDSGAESVRDYLALVHKHRGQEAHDKLREDALKEIRK